MEDLVKLWNEADGTNHEKVFKVGDNPATYRIIPVCESLPVTEGMDARWHAIVLRKDGALITLFGKTETVLYYCHVAENMAYNQFLYYPLREEARRVSRARFKEVGALPVVQLCQEGAGPAWPWRILRSGGKVCWYFADEVKEPNLSFIMELEELQGFKFTRRMKFNAARQWMSQYGSWSSHENPTRVLAERILGEPDPKKTPCHYTANGRIFEKVSYPSLEKAEVAGAEHQLRAYQCPRCQKWHLTSQV